MQIFEHRRNLNISVPPAFAEYFTGQSLGFFDIETTGLSPDRCRLVLAGLALPVDDAPLGENAPFIARQYLAEHLEEEPLVIERLLADLASLDVIITYNGDRFDLPFLDRRMAAWNFFVQPDFYSLDLLRMVRRHSDLRTFLPNLKQKTVEDFLGLWKNRTDIIDGGQSVQLYYEWLQNRDPSLLDTILLHNRDDILQLARLMQVLTKADVHRAMTDFGFPCGNFRIQQVSVEDSRLRFEGQQMTPVDYEYYGDGTLHFSFRREPPTFTVHAALHQRDSIWFADLTELNIDPSPFAKEAACRGDLLVLQENDRWNHRILNRLMRSLLERIEVTWIIET